MVWFCIITVTLFFATDTPVAEITVMVTDDTGMSVNRLLPGGRNDTYNLLQGDTIILTCDNVRGDEIIELFTPASGSSAIGDETFISMDITARSFDNGTYRCSVNTPSNLLCGPAEDSVNLFLVGESS